MKQNASSEEHKADTKDTEFGSELVVEENDAVNKVRQALFNMYSQGDSDEDNK